MNFIKSIKESAETVPSLLHQSKKSSTSSCKVNYKFKFKFIDAINFKRFIGGIFTVCAMETN